MNSLDRARRIVFETLHPGRPYDRNEPLPNLMLTAVMTAINQYDMFGMVEDFHRHFDIDYDGKPRNLEFEMAQFRLKFIREEINEWEQADEAARFEVASEKRDNVDLVFNLAKQIDALADALYVTLGTAHLQGFDIREAFRRVHRANMAKVKNPDAETSEQARKLKIFKPKGWRAPKHEDLVEDHAHTQT
jgi:predicted HAD superfamily Cof-like phosphohydrolase